MHAPLLRNTNFLRVFLGQLVSVIGDGTYTVAVIWFVKVQTGSNAAVALIALCGAVPTVLFSTFAGVIADRVDRRRLMLGADLGRALVLSVPAVLLWAGHLQLWQLYLTSALLSLLSALFGPAFAASLPQLVSADRLPTANALSQTSFALGAVLGPAVGGLLVALAGPLLAFGINIGSFLVSAALLVASKISSPVQTERAPGHWSRDLTEGLRFFQTQPLLLGMTLMVIGMNVFRTPVQVLLAGLTRDVLHAGAQGYGLLEAMLPAGFVIGGGVAARWVPSKVGPSIIWLVVGWGLMLAAVGLSRTFLATAALLLLGGVFLSITNILGSTYFQTQIPPELQGRVFGAFNAVSAGLSPVSLALVTPVAVGLGTGGTFLVSGLLMVLVGLAGYWVPGMRQLRRLVTPAT